MSDILFSDQKKYIDNLHIESDELLLEMEEFAKKNKIPILELSSAKFLEQLVNIYQPKKFLEIGTAIGYSTIRVAKILKKKCKIETIERSSNCISLAKSFINRTKFKSNISIIEGNALKVLPTLDSNYDFIFLDADKEDYISLFNEAMRILEPNGIILVDNLLWKGYVTSKEVPSKYKKSTELINKFNAIFINHPGLISTILPIGDGLGLGIKQK